MGHDNLGAGYSVKDSELPTPSTLPAIRQAWDTAQTWHTHKMAEANQPSLREYAGLGSRLGQSLEKPAPYPSMTPSLQQHLRPGFPAVGRGQYEDLE